MITGATSGIGKAAAFALAGMDFRLVLVCRNRGKGEKVIEEIRERTGNMMTELMIADMMHLPSIKALVSEFSKKYDRLHVLINNAGGIFMDRSVTEEGIEISMALNHFGPFRLSSLLLDKLKSSAPARIINVNTAGHYMGKKKVFSDFELLKKYRGMSSYGNSKLCSLLYTFHLARELEGTGVTVNAMHPGLVRTGFGKNNSSSFLMKLFDPFMVLFGISAEKGADTMIYLASSDEVEGISGKYFIKRRPARVSKNALNREFENRVMEYSRSVAFSE